MKNSISLIVVAIGLLFGFNACSNKPTVFDCYFFQNKIHSPSAYRLVLDNQNKGFLPFLDSMSSCDDVNPDAQPMLLRLLEGSHTIVLKDSIGNIKAMSIISLHPNKFSSTSNMGALQAKFSNTCTIFALSH